MRIEPTLGSRLEQAPPFDSWPEPLPLNDELPAVLPLLPAMLPSALAPWVQDAAERMNCPLDLVGIPAMVAAGSLIGRRVGIRPQQNTDWLEVGNLWGVVVAPPGQLKSPAAAEALKPIKQLEAKAAEAFAEQMTTFKLHEALYKVQVKDAENVAKRHLKSGGHDAALAALGAITEPQLPIERRYLTNDATAEKLGEICAANPSGVMVYRDELLTLLSDLDQSEKAPQRGFFMTGWGGQDGYTFDRIMRGTVRVTAVNISLFGTTQPTRLAGYIRDSLRRSDDGMVQRLQLLAWPDFDKDFREVDRAPNTNARCTAYECYDDLASFDAASLHAEQDNRAILALRSSGSRAILGMARRDRAKSARRRSTPGFSLASGKISRPDPSPCPRVASGWIWIWTCFP
jgi:hypothetical protein